MSGPKYYSFTRCEGFLEQAIEKQAKLERLFQEIKSIKGITDINLSINFDFENQINTIKDRIKNELQRIKVIRSNDQQQIKKIENRLEHRIDSIDQCISDCQELKRDFTSKISAYNDYKSYLQYIQIVKNSFEKYKVKSLKFIIDNKASFTEQQIEQVTKRIEEIESTIQPEEFSHNFSFNSARKSNITTQVIAKEAKVLSVLNPLITSYTSKEQQPVNLISNSQNSNQKVDELTKDIQQLINGCTDIKSRNNYESQLELIMLSKSLDESSYIDLHDDILQMEKSRGIKAAIQKIMANLAKQKFHTSLENEKKSIINDCSQLLQSNKIKPIQIDNVREDYAYLLEESERMFDKERNIKLQTETLKINLIASLEENGYEVMDNLQVHDFEKNDTDIHFKIPKQHNYLNIKFDESGSFHYEFQISEKIDELGTDGEKQKFTEMEITCNEFQSIIKELSDAGLAVDLASHKPIDRDALIQVKGDFIKSTKTKLKQADSLQKKYLNL